MLRALYRPSVCLSVCPSVTRVDQSKTVEVRIVQFSPHGSPIPTTWRLSVSPSTRRWRLTLKWQRQSWLVTFISRPCDSSEALCLVILLMLSLVASLASGWIIVTLCYVICQTSIFEGYSRVQNAAARIVCQASRPRHHSVDLLKDLHWLAVRGRVDYKITVLCYKAVKLQQPSYLSSLMSP